MTRARAGAAGRRSAAAPRCRPGGPAGRGRRANTACCPHAIRSRHPGRSCHGQTLASPLAMTSYLRRLLRTGAAYQLPDAVSKVIALVLLPVYTNHLTPADYGTAELLLTTIILVSIVLRLGLGEALVRFHFDDADPERRRAIARTATGTLFIATTVAALAVAALAGPISTALLDAYRPGVIRAAALGLWAFTNLELAYALLRVEERARAFAIASLANVALTVVLTVLLVVIEDQGALGLVLGNYAASALVLLGLWWVERDALGLPSRPQ